MGIRWDDIREGAAGDLWSWAERLFHHQWEGNALYRQYAEAVGKDRGKVRGLSDLPFLPISFFKERLVMTGDFVPEAVFESSGTTGMVPSRHAVRDLGLYRDQLLRNFERVYGPVGDWCILALLPSYLERGNSSLVYMVEHLMRVGGDPASGFFLDDLSGLLSMLEAGERAGRKTMLIGVGFALLDLAEGFPFRLEGTVVMETGGMKGRRKEWVREELHAYLRERLGCGEVHSEYGMTELLSQGYSRGGGVFDCPPWMRVLVREEEDPLQVRLEGRGLLNIVDLANVDSCGFIATDDIGEVYSDGRFRVLGRRDGSDLRGCSLLVG